MKFKVGAPKGAFEFLRAVKTFPREALIWTGALLCLAIAEPSAGHYALCPAALLETGWCPGCGLGRSISLLFHGEIRAAFHMHPLVFFAVIVLISRVVRLTTRYLQTYGKSN